MPAAQPRKPLPPVVLDTCVLYPLLLRDTLLRLAEEGLYDARWSEDTLVELGRNLTNKAGMSRHNLDRLLERIDRSFPLAMLSEYDHLIPAMRCHEKDRHVLAAAVQCGAGTIVTFNLADFPAESTDPHSVTVLHPDQFLLELLAKSPLDVIDELGRQAADYRHDPRTLPKLLEALSVKVPRFADEVHRWRVTLSRVVECETRPLVLARPARGLSGSVVSA